MGPGAVRRRRRPRSTHLGCLSQPLGRSSQLDVRLGQELGRAETHRPAGIAPAVRPVRTRCARTAARRPSRAGSPRARRRRAPAPRRRAAASAGSRARRARSRRDPSARRSRPGSAADAGRFRLGREVAQLERIGCEVVEQVGVAGAADVLVAAAPDHHEGAARPRRGTRRSPRRARRAPVSAGARLRPSKPAAAGRRAASSASVGARSSCETGPATRPAARPGPRTISGTRAEPSRNDILYQSPRSPSSSPWSAVKTTTCRVEPGRRERVEYLADALIEVADRRVVAMPRAPHLGVAERARGRGRSCRAGAGCADPPRPAAVARSAERRSRLVVEVPVALPHLPRVVRIRERDHQEERPVAWRARGRGSSVPRGSRPRRRSRSASPPRATPATTAGSCMLWYHSRRSSAGSASPASSRSRPGRCPWSGAPRSRAAGRGRRSASCPRVRCGSRRRAGSARTWGAGGKLGGVVVRADA